ncbi:hypothetical protein N0V88_000752 [Collariella sp. IMI 366227]|nr:hypothetical protein N0V88_000752 [Collariella sp. IMI 366227]
MRAVQAAALAIGLAALPQHVDASNVEQAHHVRRWENVPYMPWDLNTISTCTYWYDNSDGKSCKVVRDWMFAISPEDFTRWNPSVTLDCENWNLQAYCVGVASEMTSTITSSTPTSTKTSATLTSTKKLELLGWEPLGCYVDNQTLHNDTTKAGGDRLTVTECKAVCIADNFQYAGVKAGTDCWCGTFVGNSWTENQDDCNIPCPGDSAQICGGASVFNVFEAQTKDTLPSPSTPTGGISTTAPVIQTSATKTTQETATPASTPRPRGQTLKRTRDDNPADYGVPSKRPKRGTFLNFLSSSGTFVGALGNPSIVPEAKATLYDAPQTSASHLR